MSDFQPFFSPFAPHENSPLEALAIFCRAPRRGEVKTRLAQEIGADLALDFYRATLHDSFELAQKLRDSVRPQLEIWAHFTPGEAFSCADFSLREFWNGARFAQIASPYLGARIHACFTDLAARGFGKIVAIGSDSPDLPLDYLESAFAELENAPISLGPAQDGGFWAIGAHGALPETIFKGVSWSSTTVCAQIRHNLAQNGLAWRELRFWDDVDDFADLAALKTRVSLDADNENAHHTRAFFESQRRIFTANQ